MPVVHIPADRITDWNTFHDVFKDVLGFPDYYGRNMNAWIDCLTYRDEPGDGMASINVPPGDVLTLVIDGAQGLRTRCPEQFSDLIECAAFVNWRRLEKGDRSILALAWE